MGLGGQKLDCTQILGENQPRQSVRTIRPEQSCVSSPIMRVGSLYRLGIRLGIHEISAGDPRGDISLDWV